VNGAFFTGTLGHFIIARNRVVHPIKTTDRRIPETLQKKAASAAFQTP